MRTIVKTLATVVFLGTALPAVAEPTEETCYAVWSGLPVRTAECDAFIKQQRFGLSDLECSLNDACAQRARERNERLQLRREAAARAQSDAIAREQEASDRAAAAQQRAQKQRCGNDYKNPQIGMAIERAQQCVTTMRVMGQINRSDGVVTTYEGGGSFFHAMSGRIIAWGRY